MRRHAPIAAAHARRLATLALVVAGLAPPALAAAEGSPAPVGLARFTDHDRFRSAKISPRGTYLAVMALHEGRRAIVFIDLTTRAVVSSFNPAGTTVAGDFHWASDARVVVELADQDGTLAAPVSRGELATVWASSGKTKLVFGYRAGEMQTGSLIKKAAPEAAWARVVDTLRGDDRRILVAITSMLEAGDRAERLWKLDLDTGLKTEVGAAPVARADLLTDADGELRLAVGIDQALTSRSWLRTPEREWRELTGLAGFNRDSVPVAFLAKDQAVEVVEPHQKGLGLFRVSLETGQRTLLAAFDLSEPTAFLRDRETRRTVAVESHPDLPTWDVVAPEHPLARALEGLLAAYPGQHVQLIDTTEDDRVAVAYVSGDRHPGQFLVVDVAKLTAEPVVEVRPWIRPEEMSEVQAFHIAASDGFRIHGYLTLPAARPGAAPPPLVVMPHGGPHFVRDSWRFDWEAQLLASQGFAVLQVNYRGSGGYGTAFQEAGYRHWGDRMVQDVVDAARWAARKGKVDGTRVCAMGTSFGAYAAMQAAILAPDLIRCAAGLSGVYDLTMMDWRGDISWSGLGRGYVKRAVGEDPATLRAFSPVYNAARLTAPVFLAHGGRDERTPLAHAERLKEALTGQGRPPGWLVEPTEGHGFYDEAARLRLYQRVVAFLVANTAPAAIATPTPTP